jgi:hypothetical protein
MDISSSERLVPTVEERMQILVIPVVGMSDGSKGERWGIGGGIDLPAEGDQGGIEGDEWGMTFQKVD